MVKNNKSTQYLDEAFSEINEELLKTFISKHKDYGKGNILDTGELGIVFRINDKLRRLQNLRESGKKPTNEAIEDTWIDIAVYAAIALLVRSGKFKKLNLNPKV
jgi:hypothetical protein